MDKQYSRSEDGIRINLSAYDHRILDKSSADIVKAARRTGARTRGPIPIPTHTRKYTVISGPHIHKKSRKQFERRKHKRVVHIDQLTPQTLYTLGGLDLASGVAVEVESRRKL